MHLSAFCEHNNGLTGTVSGFKIPLHLLINSDEVAET